MRQRFETEERKQQTVQLIKVQQMSEDFDFVIDITTIISFFVVVSMVLFRLFYWNEVGYNAIELG